MIESLALVPWTGVWPHLLGTVLVAYLMGSVPFGLIFAWWAGGGDVRKIGSGNIGATNVLRTGKRWAAAATLFFDAAKGYAAVRLASDYGGQVFATFAGLAVFLGHLYPVWLKFKGGKGVAVYIGLLIGLYWPGALIFCAVWLLVAFVSRYSSLAALIASALTPLALWLLGQAPIAALFLLLSALLWIMHRANIARLLDGSEGRIGAKSTPAA